MNLNLLGNLGILSDNVVRKYHIEVISKYSISDRPLFDVCSNMEMSIVHRGISGEYDTLEIEILQQNNSYGLEFVEPKYLKLMDEVNNIQSHLLISMDKEGKIRDVLNFPELHEKWEQIKEKIDVSSQEMSKIVKDGDEEYSKGTNNFAEQLNKTTLYRALGLGLLSFDKAKDFCNVINYDTPSLLFPNIVNRITIERDDVVHFNDTPATLQVYKSVKGGTRSKMQSEFIKSFPFLKRQMGEYKFDLFCTVEKDNETFWPNSLDFAVSESISPLLSDVTCKIELIKD
ncbi:hypothetical protein [Bacteroides heparinolyticus]|uniref:hypothetical protein n=2 Tax=Prevotella heparinolytica TaxID=28113 RepID=UPI0035A0C866